MSETKKKQMPPNAGKGRKPGTPNKTTQLLKDAILEAAKKAGGTKGLVGYLTTQATKNPKAFLSLLGRVLPTQVTGEDGGALVVTIKDYTGRKKQDATD